MKLGFIGAGSMASALARGVGEPALVHDVDHARAEALVNDVGGEVVESASELARSADVVVLGHKPAQLDEVAEAIGGEARAIASIVAATPVARLEQIYPATPVYRFIPNIPVEVGRGIFGYAAGSLAADGPEDELLERLGRAGTVVALDDGLIDASMAVMSCGPAFLALVAEALADAGVRHGLDEKTARRLVVETMAGSAAWLDANALDTGSLMRRVATPGGLTEKGLGVLEERGLRGAFDGAVDLIMEATG